MQCETTSEDYFSFQIFRSGEEVRKKIFICRGRTRQQSLHFFSNTYSVTPELIESMAGTFYPQGETVMEKRMFSIKELAHYIGLAPQTIRNQLYAGRFPIPPKRLGRKLLWDKKTVDRYLDRLSEVDC